MSEISPTGTTQSPFGYVVKVFLVFRFTSKKKKRLCLNLPRPPLPAIISVFAPVNDLHGDLLPVAHRFGQKLGYFPHPPGSPHPTPITLKCIVRYDQGLNAFT